MKKVLTLALAIVMVFALCLSASAAFDKATAGDDCKATWTNTVHVSYDEIRNGDDTGHVVCGDNVDNTFAVLFESGATGCIFWGWTSASAEITGFSYTINGGEAVTNPDFTVEAEPAVVNAGPGDYDSRMKIAVPLTEGTQLVRCFANYASGAEMIWMAEITVGEATTYTDAAAGSDVTPPATSDAAVVVIAAVAAIALAGVVVVKKVRA